MSGTRSKIQGHATGIAAALTLGCALAFNTASAAPTNTPAEQSLHLHNLHTKETINVVYKRDGKYVPAGLQQINRLLRDHRRNEETQINPKTLDRLYDIGQAVKRYSPGIRIKFEIISGYRALQTNNALRAAGGAQGKDSQHTHGNAIDFRIPGVSTETSRDVAWCTGSGGVGYYKQDGFVHIDTARKRFWPANWNPAHINCAKFK